MESPPAAPTLPRVLVIDDEQNLRHVLGVILRRAGYEVVTAADGREGLDVLARDPRIRIVLCDVRMPRLDGLGFLDELGPRAAEVYTVVMSAYGSMQLAVEALKRGAYDYISKPFKPDEILLVLRKVVERERLVTENARLREAVAASAREEVGFVGRSPAVRRLLDLVQKVAVHPTTVLLQGESGTGKELLARAIHRLSDRVEGPWVAVNCGAIPGELLESELFGHERGAFTGAHRTRRGLFEQADGGTLLLDEIGELPVPLQPKLLRVLQEGVVRRVGGDRDIPVDVRVVAATARDLVGEVQRGRFRQDLFYRLDVVRITLPPLRERREDIPLLVDHFIRRHAARLGRDIRGIEHDALAVLEAHPWPGNVRQLENALERAVVMAAGPRIALRDLGPDILAAPEAPAEEEEDLSIKRGVARLERELIRKALARTGGNRRRAAELLEISYKALLYKIRDYGVEVP